MFVRLMELIEKNSGKLASNILGDVRRREEARRKGGFAPGPDDGGDPGKGSAIYEDLLEWLFDNLQKDNLISYYSSLGEQTHLRGARLEEIVTAILVIQKEIMTLIIDEIDGGGRFLPARDPRHRVPGEPVLRPGHALGHQRLPPGARPGRVRRRERKGRHVHPLPWVTPAPARWEDLPRHGQDLSRHHEITGFCMSPGPTMYYGTVSDNGFQQFINGL